MRWLAVPLLQRLRISQMPGFLLVGLCFGPHGLGSLAGGRLTRLLDPRTLQLAFACLLVALALWIGSQNLPQLP